MVVGIGMLLSLIGLKSAGIVVANPDTMVSLGELRTVDVAIFTASLTLMATLMHHKVGGDQTYKIGVGRGLACP